MTIANEQATYRNGKPSMLGRGIDKLTNPIGKALGSVVPSVDPRGVCWRASTAPSARRR